SPHQLAKRQRALAIGEHGLGVIGGRGDDHLGTPRDVDQESLAEPAKRRVLSKRPEEKPAIASQASHSEPRQRVNAARSMLRGWVVTGAGSHLHLQLETTTWRTLTQAVSAVLARRIGQPSYWQT